MVQVGEPVFAGQIRCKAVDLSHGGVQHHHLVGIGLGGAIVESTVSSSLVFSLVNAPWQLATATLNQQTPTNGATITVTHKGYAHGPPSAPSSTALTGGVIQLVSPTQLHNTGIGVGNHDTVALFTTLTLTAELALPLERFPNESAMNSLT